MKRRCCNEKQTPRDLALHLLSRVEEQGAYADRVLAAPQVSRLEQRDRLFVRELLLGVLRWKLRIDRIIEKNYKKSLSAIHPEIRNILRLGLFQMMFMNSVPVWAAVDESVRLAKECYGKGVTGLVNAILRRFSREGEPPFPTDSAERLSFEESHPLWLVKRWIANYGEKTSVSICKSANEKHPVFIRAQANRITVGELSSILAEQEFDTSKVTKIPGYLMVTKANGLFETPAFNKGLFTVQDPSSGMASHLLAPEPGETILDLCAAPGGKTTQCAELMRDCGHITAVDVKASRIELVKETVQRLGLTSIACVRDDARTFGRDDEIRYDRVLLDAPCSGTGIFSKRPDMKWRLQEKDCELLGSLQRELLQNAANLVKPGGVLVYSTCSLEPEENEENILWFLESYKEFSCERDERFHDFEIENGYLILPHHMQGTGAFAAKLRRE